MATVAALDAAPTTSKAHVASDAQTWAARLVTDSPGIERAAQSNAGVNIKRLSREMRTLIDNDRIRIRAMAKRQPIRKVGPAPSRASEPGHTMAIRHRERRAVGLGPRGGSLL